MEERKEISIELKSEPMNEMLSHPPSWITRSGNGLFLFIILIVVGLSWVIEYPDEIEGDVTVTASEPPIEMSNQLYVQLKKIHVTDLQQIHKGQIIAEFDNRANTKDIEIAKNYLIVLKALDLKKLQLLPLIKTDLQLGSYQVTWSSLQNKLIEWNNLYQDNLFEMEISSMEKEITFRERLQTIANKKIKLSERDYLLIQEELESSERLAKEDAISKQTLNQDRKSESQAMQTVQGQKEQYVQNLIQLNSLRKEIIQLKHNLKKEEEKRISDIQLDIIVLQNSFSDWEKSSIWVSPCDGKVLFNKQLQINKFYSANQASIVIVPKGQGYLTIATISSAGAGKIKKGQKANIELVDFPKTEYGMLEGIVSSITHIDKEGKYEVKITLPKQLKTSYNKQLPVKVQLKGKVKIITKKKRLLERFFEKIIDLVK
jgi:multidrug resistance efflux pump